MATSALKTALSWFTSTMPYCEEPTRSVDADAEEADAEDEEALPEEVTAVVETYVITIGLYPGAVTTPLLMIV
jgi:hypothetical protein